MLKKENFSNSSYQDMDPPLIQADNMIYQVGQVFAVIYTLLSFFWLIYMISDIHRQVKLKRNLMATTMYDRNSNNEHKIYSKNENIFRSVLLVLFLLFELVFNVSINVYGCVYTLVDMKYIMIPIGPNCSVNSNTFIGTGYDTRLNQIILFAIGLMGDYSFSVMMWLFAATLFHMSFACKNQLHVKKVVYFILSGIIINIFFTLLTAIPFVSVFTQIAQSLVDQISVLVVIYIARKKFFPAMDSRIKAAYHTYNIGVYYTQMNLNKLYKYLITFVVLTFELYVLKNLIFYNMFMLLETISDVPCWFRVTYHLPMYELPEHIKEIIHQISYCNLIMVHILDLLVYFNFIFLNVNFLVIHIRKYLRRKKIKHHYPIASAHLLENDHK